MDLSPVIIWVGLGLCGAEPQALHFLFMCQLDFVRVSEWRSIERFRTQDTGHRATGYETGYLVDLPYSTLIAATLTWFRMSTDTQTRYVYR
jgi:hypothetical protein